MNGYDLSRMFWDFSFTNPELIKPNHCAVYFFAIEHCNRLGWKDKFGFPTTMVMEAVGIKSYNTYKSTLDDLVKFGFIKMIESSKNQYSSNIIALKENDKANDKALDKAFDKALIKHTTKQGESILQSIDSIDKQSTINKQRINKATIDNIFSFSEFWTLYPNKVAKDKCKDKYYKLTLSEIQKIKDTISKFIKYKPFDTYNHPNPETYINQKRWNDEFAEKVTDTKNGAKVQTDKTRIGYGKIWDEMTNDEKLVNKRIATSPQLIQFNTETGDYEW